MPLDITVVSQLEPYEDEEEIQLMDTDQTNLQVEEQPLTDTDPTTVPNREKHTENIDNSTKKKNIQDDIPSLKVIEVY